LARIYEFQQTKERDLEGQDPSKLDPISRRALGRFWLSALGIIVVALILFGLSRQVVLPFWNLTGAVISGVVALALLFVMNRALRKIKLVSPEEAKVDRR